MEYVQFGEKGILKRQTQADMGVSQGIAKGFARAQICGDLFVAVQGTVPTITTYTSTREMVCLNGNGCHTKTTSSGMPHYSAISHTFLSIKRFPGSGINTCT
jgi:hypothetical protein